MTLAATSTGVSEMYRTRRPNPLRTVLDWSPQEDAAPEPALTQLAFVREACADWAGRVGQDRDENDAVRASTCLAILRDPDYERVLGRDARSWVRAVQQLSQVPLPAIA